MPKMKILELPIAEITLDPRNARTHDKINLAAIAASLKRFGQQKPIVVDQAGTVVAGNGTVAAARELGWTSIRAVRTALAGPDQRDYAIADNRSAELAEWDDKALAALLEDASSRQALDGTGFTARDLDKLLADLERAESAAGQDADPRFDDAAELVARWGVKPGSLWTIPGTAGEHRLLVGDSRKPEDVARLFGADRAAWMWTDPPYGVSYTGKTKAKMKIENDGAAELPELLGSAFAAADSVLLEGAPVYVAAPAGPRGLVFGAAFSANWRLHQMLVWEKDRMVMGHSDYHYQHELILYGWKQGQNRAWFGGRTKTSVLRFDRPKVSDKHPTTKPVPLVEECLRNSTAPGGIGFEPFAGSGTTLIAAENTRRRCFGIEIDPKYAAVILQRMADCGRNPKEAARWED